MSTCGSPSGTPGDNWADSAGGGGSGEPGILCGSWFRPVSSLSAALELCEMIKERDFLFKETKPHFCPQTDPSEQLLSKRMGPGVRVPHVPGVGRLLADLSAAVAWAVMGLRAWMLCILTLPAQTAWPGPTAAGSGSPSRQKHPPVGHAGRV